MRVVVLGGFGNFGARICRALANDPGIEVVPAGRTDRGDNSAHLDLASADSPERLKTLAPGLVIHCAGPFQGQDYRVAEAAIAAGALFDWLAGLLFAWETQRRFKAMAEFLGNSPGRPSASH